MRWELSKTHRAHEWHTHTHTIELHSEFRFIAERNFVGLSRLSSFDFYLVTLSVSTPLCTLTKFQRLHAHAFRCYVRRVTCSHTNWLDTADIDISPMNNSRTYNNSSTSSVAFLFFIIFRFHWCNILCLRQRQQRRCRLFLSLFTSWARLIHILC